MTGQVKEDIISRFNELGVQVEEGRIGFLHGLASEAEFLARPAAFDYLRPDGAPRRLDLQPGTLGFTLCQVPVVVHRAGPRGLRITGPDGNARDQAGLRLDAAASRAVFERTGTVQRLDAFLGL